MIFLQVENIDLNRAWEISPYNGMAYGALIIVLIMGMAGIVYLLKKEMDENYLLNKENKELNSKVHMYADVMIGKITELQSSYNQIKENNSEIRIFKEKILYVLEDLKSYVVSDLKNKK